MKFRSHADHAASLGQSAIRNLESGRKRSEALDIFAGTFTTCFVAKGLGRRSIGIELEEPFVKIGLRRLNLSTHFNGELLVRPAKTCECDCSLRENCGLPETARNHTLQGERSLRQKCLLSPAT